MHKQRMRKIVLSTLTASVLTLGGGLAPAQTVGLEDIFAASAEGNKVAQASQVRIDDISKQTDRLVADYKKLLKEIEGLRQYNTQLQRQIDKQVERMGELRNSIENVTLIERQIMPLMMRMVSALEEFVELDIPFLIDERRDRLGRLNDTLDDAEISASEKFRVVFEAYQIESEYGRSIFAYTGTLAINDREYEGDFLRMGRVGLYFKNGSGSVTAMWNIAERRWDELDSSYTDAVLQGIQMARSQIQADLVRLPISAPE